MTKMGLRSNLFRPHPEEYREAMHLEGWAASPSLLPSFETRPEFTIGPRFARTRWAAPQDEGGASGEGEGA